MRRKAWGSLDSYISVKISKGLGITLLLSNTASVSDVPKLQTFKYVSFQWVTEKTWMKRVRRFSSYVPNRNQLRKTSDHPTDIRPKHKKKTHRNAIPSSGHIATHRTRGRDQDLFSI